MLTPKPSDAYRRVDLDARIEASSGLSLTLICLEEAVASLGQAVLALERQPNVPPSEPLSRAHGIAIWLGRSVAPESPLYVPMTQFYGGLAATLTRNMSAPDADEIAQVRQDFADMLEASSAG